MFSFIKEKVSETGRENCEREKDRRRKMKLLRNYPNERRKEEEEENAIWSREFCDIELLSRHKHVKLEIRA